MEQRVRVKELLPGDRAEVVHMRQSACSGDCHQCSGCGAAQETISLVAENPVGAVPGDVVVIESATGPVLKAAAMLYLVPMALFFAGYLLGAMLGNHGSFVGCLAFLLGIGIAVVYDRRIARKRKTVYTITGFAGESLLKHKRKGDYDVD